MESHPAEPPFRPDVTHRRVLLALGVVLGVMAAILLGIFAAFGAPGTGLVVVAVLLLPTGLLAWWDSRRRRLRRRP